MVTSVPSGTSSNVTTIVTCVAPPGTVPWSPNREIDARRWVPLDEAAALLTYPHDRELLDTLREELT